MNRNTGTESSDAATAAVLNNSQLSAVDQKTQLAAAFRVFGRRGFDLGVAGHITVRHEDDPDLFWVNPLSTPFSRMRVSDLLLVDHDGKVISGDGVVNHSAFIIHAHIHAARPDVNAVAHAHSTFGVAWASLGRLLPASNQNACVFYEDHILFDEYFGPVLLEDEGARIAAQLRASGAKAAILQNHGVLTVGGSVAQAAWWFIAFERACQVQLLAESSASAPVLVSHEVALDARRVSGTPASGDLGFQPLLEEILSAEPDLCD